MSRPPLPPRGQVLRRRVRETVVIPLPDAPRPRKAQNARRHAKTFVLALATVIGLGATFLSSPWASRTGEWTPFVDALFTAVSAASVTGLVTLDTATHWNFFGQLVIVLLIQAGGLGFMVGAGILLQILRRGQSRLSDVLLMQDGAPTLSVREAIQLSRRIVRFALVTEAVGAILLTIRFRQDMPLDEAIWFGIFHAVSAFCNAGFDLTGGFDSLIPYETSPFINGVVMLLIQAGALSYMVLADVVSTRRWRAFALDTKLVLLVHAIMVVGTSVLFLVSEWNYSLAGKSLGSKSMDALFQSIAARTAGFSTVDFGQVHAATLFLWVVVMAVGGAAGSTAGGMKLATVGIVFVAVISTLRGDSEPRAFSRSIPTPLIMRAMSVIFIFIAVHFVITLGLVASEFFSAHDDIEFIDMMFEAMSATATVGLSTGITSEIADVSKLLLCAAMFFGRLGPLTTAYALQRRQRPAHYRFPTAPVRIG